MENKIKCPRCGNEEVWKSGKPRGKQQYKCKECKKKFITELNYTKEFKQNAIKMLYEGNSSRAVGRIMGIDKSTVYNWVKKAEKNKSSSCEDELAAELPQPVAVIEMGVPKLKQDKKFINPMADLMRGKRCLNSPNLL